MSLMPEESSASLLELVSAAGDIRLDAFLASELSSLPDYQHVSRSQVKRLIEAGGVRIGPNLATKAGVLLRQGDKVTVALGHKVFEPEGRPKPMQYDLQIVFEDKRLLVINKPPNLTVHPGAGNRDNTLVNALVGHLGDQHSTFKSLLTTQGIRAGIVHRLDKDTSGLLVIAKDIEAHNLLAKQFAAHTVGRAYLALVYASPRAKSALRLEQGGLVDAAIGRHPTRRKEMAVVSGAKAARTHWEVVARMEYAVLIRVKLETGRTHQIRVHMNHLGAPLIGDRLYGDISGLPKQLLVTAQKFGRQALHAYLLEFEHPDDNKRMRFEAELPDDFRKLIVDFGGELASLKDLLPR